MTKQKDANQPTSELSQRGVIALAKQTRNAHAADERARIENAIEQLLKHVRTDATSWPNVSELARVAGVKRWVLTHKHTDLRERFQTAIADLKTSGVNLPAAQASMSAQQRLQQEVTRLRSENAELRDQVAFYANALHGISLAYHALTTERGSAPTIVGLPMSRPPGEHHTS